MICVGVGTKIDPTLCRADRMVGQVLGAVGALPEIFTELEISYFLLRRLLGVRTEGDKKAAKVRPTWVDSRIFYCHSNIHACTWGGLKLRTEALFAQRKITQHTSLGASKAAAQRALLLFKWTGLTIYSELWCPNPNIFVSLQVQKLSKNEVLMVNIGSLSTGGRVSAVKADLAKIVLTNPVCTEVGEKIALSRRVEKHWR